MIAATRTSASVMDFVVKSSDASGFVGSSACPLTHLVARESRADCKYETVCPSPCSALHRLQRK